MQVAIPSPPKQIFENNFSSESLVTHEAQSIFWIERVEYPEEGGIYIYKYGAIPLQREKVSDEKIRKYVERGNGILGDINKILKDEDFNLQIDGNQIQLVPTELLARPLEPDPKTRIDCLYPEKGFPTPEAVSACNFAKRALISQLRFLTQKSILICLSLLLLLPFRSKIKLIERFINEFNGLSETVLTPVYLKDNYLCYLAKELQKLITIFLIKTGISEQYALAFGKNIATLIEYDTAYKYRIEDIMSETTSQKLKIAPRQEIKRLLAIFATRDINITTQAKFNTIGKILSLALLVPKIKQAFQQALNEIDFTKLQLDEADRYHVLKYDRYNFLGRTLEDRYNEYVKLHNGFPPAMQMISSQNNGIG